MKRWGLIFFIIFLFVLNLEARSLNCVDKKCKIYKKYLKALSIIESDPIKAYKLLLETISSYPEDDKEFEITIKESTLYGNSANPDIVEYENTIKKEYYPNRYLKEIANKYPYKILYIIEFQIDEEQFPLSFEKNYDNININITLFKSGNLPSVDLKIYVNDKSYFIGNLKDKYTLKIFFRKMPNMLKLDFDEKFVKLPSYVFTLN